MLKVAIIGAGAAGLAAARALNEVAEVTVFDKSRGVGGRMSTRYAGDWEFDHGAQFFTLRSDDVSAFLNAQLETEVIVPWQPAVAQAADGETRRWAHPRYVAGHRMNVLPKALARDVQVHTGCTISALTSTPNGWQLHTTELADPCGPFDWVISAVPSAQAAALLPDTFAHKQRLSDVVMKPCHALMVGFSGGIDCAWQVLEPQTFPFAWIARNDSKPGRDTRPSFVAHTSIEWSDANLEREPKTLHAELLDAFAGATGLTAQPDHVSVHRWRYARTETPLGEPALLDAATKLIACGDWCIEGKVEAAFQSGLSAAEHLKAAMATGKAG